LRCAGQVEANAELCGVVSEFCEILSSNICDVVADRRATFVLRTALVVFGGFSIPSSEGDYLETVKKLESRCGEEGKFTSCFKQLMEGLCGLDASEIEELAESPHSSVTLQTALLLSQKATSCKELLGRILSSDSDSIFKFLNDSVKSKLIEVAVSVSGSLLPSLVVDFMGDSDRLDRLYECKFAFSFIQALVSSVEDADSARLIFNDVFTVEGMVKCVKKGKNHGIAVVQALAEKLTIPKFLEYQKPFFANISKAAHVEDGNIWMTLMGLHPTVFDEGFFGFETPIDESKITPQGCLFLSTLFRFKVSSIQPLLSFAKPLIDHLGTLELEQSRFFTDVGPGRMVQTLISSECCFPNTIKMKIIRNFMLNDEQRLAKLVADRRVGAWLVTTAWDSCDVPTKTLIGEKLLKIDGLRDSNWKIWKHCSLASFSRRNDEWTKTETRKIKAKNLLSDIVGGQQKRARS
jgi:hypothetical protein